jgi:hypothetical protein
MMRSRVPLTLTSLLAVVAFSSLAAGCGGGNSPGVANVGSAATTATTPQPGLLGYATCMRSHGVADFPDPSGQGAILKPQVVAAFQQDPHAFKAADTACRHLLPNGSLGPQETPQQQHARLADMLSFARCMRSHGVSRFPDPTAQGDLSVEMVQAQGIDVHSPAVLRVVQTCLPASHGGLTPARVREAIGNAAG